MQALRPATPHRSLVVVFLDASAAAMGRKYAMPSSSSLTSTRPRPVVEAESERLVGSRRLVMLLLLLMILMPMRSYNVVFQTRTRRPMSW